MSIDGDRGAGLVEFGLLVAALAVCLVGSVFFVGSGVSGMIGSALAAFAGATG